MSPTVCPSAILLGHMRMSVADIRQALTQMDESILTPELLKQMLAYAPDANEVVLSMSANISST